MRKAISISSYRKGLKQGRVTTMDFLKRITDTTYKCKECSDTIARLCVIKFDHSLRLICPCSVCLVKMMCKKLCEPRNNIYSNLSNNEKFNLFNKVSNKDAEVHIKGLLRKEENET